MGNGEKPIVVVGSINIDLVANAGCIPAPGETVLGSNFQMHAGGKGANQAVAVARLGYPVRMIGKIGSDALGSQLRASLQSAGVDHTGVAQVDGPSGVAMIVVAPRGENCIVVTPGANAQVTPEFVEENRAAIRDAALVLAQLEIPVEAVLRVAELCSEYGVPFVLDPAPAQRLPHDLLKRVTWFTPNETEAAFFVAGTRNGDSDRPSAMAQRLLACGPRGVLLKLGSRGAFLATRQAALAIDAIPVEAVDTTAAGDAFNGAFAVGLALGKDPESSACFAAAAAAISVTRAGAQPSMPILDEVEQLLRQTPQNH